MGEMGLTRISILRFFFRYARMAPQLVIFSPEKSNDVFR